MIESVNQDKKEFKMPKIAMVDLVHTTCGTHSNTVPLGVGLMATYLKKNITQPLDIKIFKDPDKLLGALNGWIPDIIGITQYTWNSKLNLYFARKIKSINPNCLIIAGGPDLEMSDKKRETYLLKNRCVDLCVAYDGEIPLLEIVKEFLNGKNIRDLRKVPVKGAYCLDLDTLEYVKTEGKPRLDSLDLFGPVYSEGVFDEFLDAGYHPFMQTHRGCPFSCAYCRTSDPYNSKMLFLSPEIFKQDMEYLGKRFANRPEIMLYVANTNMSLFKEDFPIAHIIREIQDKYNWPKYVYFDTGKDPQKLLDMLSIIKFVPAPALQTLTPSVLKIINRKNLPFDNYMSFQREVLQRTGENSMSELILCLPGETKETFMETFRKVLNSGVQSIVVYTLIKLPGTPISTDEFVNKYEFLLRYRVVPRQFSKINGEVILDTEEVIVGTKDMSYEDYLYFRGFCFVLTVFFNAVEFIPLKKFLLECEVDVAQWLFNIYDHIQEYPVLYHQFQNYMIETEEELFKTSEDLENFFEKDENYDYLISGRRGDNLLRKYKHLVFSSDFKSCMSVGSSEAFKIISATRPNLDSKGLIENLSRFLSVRDLKPVLENNSIDLKQNIDLEYDIVSWLKSKDGSCRLEDLKGQFKYSVQLEEAQKKMLKNISGSHKDVTLSMQMLFRDGSTKDLWPKWTPV